MYISHDGDRITTWRNGAPEPYRSPYEDEYLDRLAQAVRESNDPARYSPAYQPGGYRCSVNRLDRLVDRCKELPGVIGAGLTGAGLGGAILALIRQAESENIAGEMKALVSTWLDHAPVIENCKPMAGASLIQIPDGYA